MNVYRERPITEMRILLIVTAALAMIIYFTLTQRKPIIESQGFPYAGEQFQFTVVGTTGKTKIEVHIDDARIFVDDCPDEPCHELILIPVSTRGSVLRIIVRDSYGNTTKRKFMIS